MTDVRPLPADSLRWNCDPQQLEVRSTDELTDLQEILGQVRALEAVKFGLAIRREGFNLYVLGPPGIGKQSLVRQCLAEKSVQEPTPPDWCYVNNFDDLRKPQAISVPPGRGVKFRDDVADLVDDMNTAIPAALETDEHKSRVQSVQREQIERHERVFDELAKKALSQGVQLLRTPGGFAFAPIRNHEVLSPDEFQKLSSEERAHIEETVSALQNDLQAIIEQIPKWHKEARDRLKALHREAVQMAIGHLIARIKERYTDLPQVLAYFDAVQKDILERVDEFQPSEDGANLVNRTTERSFDDYEINLLVDNSVTRGAPVVYDDFPSYHNLLGRVEHESHMGALLTDFTMVKPGSLHRANGGYLLLDALRLLQQPFAWEGLKRALSARCIKIESLGEMLSLISTLTLEPEPIPLDVKVVLLGDRMLYYLLYDYDPDFADLFKVAADFDEHFHRTPENCRLYARFIATLVRREKFRPLTSEAIARTIEHGVRVAADNERISLHTRTIADVLREADHWAKEEGSAMVEARHIQLAIDKQIFRADRVRQRLQEEIVRGTILVDTQGSRVAQVNGLSVLDLGTFRFGQPSRITATVRLGRGEVVNIEREVELSGAIHSKGVLILSAFLAARYSTSLPLSLSATLVFEQTYGMIDGDSASVAELCALLSALADTPVQQNLAITGSVNQHGQVQAIGGVNEKIEGFFDVCRARGLTGEQGVLIPASNVKHLMVRLDVAMAVAEGRFHVYPIETVDQAISVLTGIVAGDRGPDGAFPAGSVNQRVDARLTQFANLRIQFGREAAESDRRKEQT